MVRRSSFWRVRYQAREIDISGVQQGRHSVTRYEIVPSASEGVLPPSPRTRLGTSIFAEGSQVSKRGSIRRTRNIISGLLCLPSIPEI
jgi:hypothetical protein